MSQSPDEAVAIDREHPYAQAARQLNELVRLGHSFSGHERNCCFLNVQGGRFANVSAVSGLDFPDDGRAVVRSDWDFDGDLDLWVANRTAPQVRFLRNDLSTGHHFLRFRLVGTTSNRDAIGARVLVRLPDAPSTAVSIGSGTIGNELSQTVRAGEGFLAQSSKWVHFGLGSAQTIQQLEVQWPTGVVEKFDVPAEVDRCYRLVEGSGAVKEWTPPAMVPPSRRDPPESHRALVAGDVSHHILSQPAPLPPLVFEPFGESTGSGGDIKMEDATRPTGHPVLLNLWASWCAPCVIELREFVERAADLEQFNLRIVALSVGDESGQSSDSTAARKFLQDLDFSHAAGLAAPELLDRLQLVNNMIYRDDHRRLPMPSSLLIDGQGRLAAIYKGPISVDKLLEDVQRLTPPAGESSSAKDAGTDAAQARHTEFLPFAGRWLGLPGPHDTVRLAADLWDHGLGPDAIEMANRMSWPEYRGQRIDVHWLNAVRLRTDGNLTDALGQLRAVLDLEPEHPDAHMEVGTILAENGDVNAALAHLQRAVNHFDPPRAEAFVNLGMALRKLNRLDEADGCYRQALSIEANTAEAHAGVGLIRAAQRRFAEAAASFERAALLDRKSVPYRLNLAAAWMSAGEPQRALPPLEDAQQIEPESVVVLSYLGQVYSEVAQVDAAIEVLTRVVALQPDAAKVWFRLAELYESQSDLSAALQHYREAARLVPDDETVQSRIARILSALAEDE